MLRNHGSGYTAVEEAFGNEEVHIANLHRIRHAK
jgi:hypothetical protein